MICPGQMLKDIDHDHEIVNVLIEVAMNDEIVKYILLPTKKKNSVEMLHYFEVVIMIEV